MGIGLGGLMGFFLAVVIDHSSSPGYVGAGVIGGLSGIWFFRIGGRNVSTGAPYEEAFCTSAIGVILAVVLAKLTGLFAPIGSVVRAIAARLLG